MVKDYKPSRVGMGNVLNVATYIYHRRVSRKRQKCEYFAYVFRDSDNNKRCDHLRIKPLPHDWLRGAHMSVSHFHFRSLPHRQPCVNRDGDPHRHPWHSSAAKQAAVVEDALQFRCQTTFGQVLLAPKADGLDPSHLFWKLKFESVTVFSILLLRAYHTLSARLCTRLALIVIKGQFQTLDRCPQPTARSTCRNKQEAAEK